jgi:hypothetical protein
VISVLPTSSTAITSIVYLYQSSEIPVTPLPDIRDPS